MSYKQISPIPVVEGGTGNETLTNHGLLIGAGTSAITQLSVAGNGTVLIGNSAADPSFSATPSVTSITIANAPVAATDGTNKAYVDLIASGFEFKNSCFAGSTTALTVTYLNGLAGVGATLTNASTQATFSIDGQTPAVSSRILIKDQSSTFQNGIYTVTNVGSGSTNWILTRSLDYDMPSQIHPGDVVPIEFGTVNASTLWLQTQTVATIGTDAILFTKFLGNGIVSLAGNSGSATGSTVTVSGGNNISTSGSGSTLTVNVAGTTQHAVQIGNATNSLTSISVGTNGQLLIGATTADPSWVTPTAGSGLAVTTNSTTLSYAISAPVSIANGGTNATSMTTADGTIYYDGTRLVTTATGTSGWVLTSGGAGVAPTYQVVSASGAVTSVAGGNNITITGTATAPIVNVSGTTNHAVQIGNSTNSLTSVSVGTNGQLLIAATTADPTWVTPTAGSGLAVTTNATTLSYAISAPISIANGGTNATAMTITDGTVYFDGTRLVTVAATGASGTVLTSGGPGVAPSFQALPSSSITITGDTGGGLISSSFTFTGGTTGLAFGGSGTTETLTFAGITANNGVVNLGTDNAANAINIGVGTTARAIHIGDSAAAHVLTIGSTSGAASLTERVGTGNYSLDGVAGSTYTIGASTTTGTYTLGGTAQTGTITLGSSSGANILNIANGSGATTVNIAAVQTAGSYNVGAAMTTGTITIGGTGLQTGTITFGGGTGAQTVNVGTGATGVKTINIGTSAVANVITVGTVTGAASLALKSGSGNIVSNAGLTVDSTGRMFNTVQPTFLVHLSATTSAITGDGTLATIVWNTKDYDIGTNFNTSTGVFTAPITGKYAFFTNITLGSLTALYTSYANDINTASNTIRVAGFPGIERDASNRVSTPISFIGQMTAGDTAQVRVNVSGSTKAVTVLSASADTSQSFFSGTLIC